jgi:Flp pilus assembly pilin Flp
MDTRSKDFASRAKGCEIGDDERGATVIEYALLLSLVALAIFASLNLVGAATNQLFTRLAAELQPSTPSSANGSGSMSGTNGTVGASGASGTGAASGTSAGSNHGAHDDRD